MPNDQKQPISSVDAQYFPGVLTTDADTSSSSEHNYQQLRECVQKLKSAPSGPNHVDDAYKAYYKIKDKARASSESLLTPRPRHQESSVLLSPLSNMDNGHDFSFDSSNLRAIGTTSSMRSRSPTEQVHNPSYVAEQNLDAIRDWKSCLDTLLETIKSSLLETYEEYQHDATPDMVEQLLNNKSFRKTAIHRMRNASITKMLSANLDFFPKYEIRFRNYDRVKADLVEIRHLLQAGESGISPDRRIEEIVISPQGDAILEFANTASESSAVLRFRVLSHMLAENSPIFSQMFNPGSVSLSYEDAASLPPPPTRYVCKDGCDVKLYRMPQFEINHKGSFEILLHAAHMHNDPQRVPREIAFDRFIAIAEACMRYQCTSPLEIVVEYRWLPQWMHKATEDMSDGLLLISYAFGLQHLFTLMSKTAILNIVDEEDLAAKTWPPKIKSKVWAVRAAKMDQVLKCCTDTIQEYLPPPLTVTPDPTVSSNLNLSLTRFVPSAIPFTTPQCSKGSSICDATNLGWLLMIFNNLQLLPHIMRPASILNFPPCPPSTQNLKQVVDSLRRVTSPPHPQAHKGVCDFAPAFRSAINDIYCSISGLTLFDVSGRHGWALSKHNIDVPQDNFRLGAPLHDALAARRDREEVALSIMGYLDTMEDVVAVAMVDRVFYEAYEKNKLTLMEGLIRKMSGKGVKSRTVSGARSRRDAVYEPKALRHETRAIKSQAKGRYGDSFMHNSSGLNDDDEGSFNSDLHEAGCDDLVGIDIVVSPMTREDAEKYLWPENDEGSLNSKGLGANQPQDEKEKTTAKCRMSDITLVEDKSLVVPENKHLRGGVR